jgi:hypothetical protein
MTRKRSRTVSEIPLHLVPRAVSRQVQDRGDAMSRISIRRTHWHDYNETIRTKSVRKELTTRSPVAESLTESPHPETRSRGWIS